MRLLRWNNHAEFSLTADLHGDEIPPYAILSHTWGADHDEVTFADLQHRPGHQPDKGGYQKIRFCGEQARRDGVEYFWVDTCCIDKNNHSELSEAITSMYRWYCNAQKCYVHLSDVSTDQAGSCNGVQSMWESRLRTSRWFTRGWTLQELLAPPMVEFYSREGEFLGTKKTLAEQIQQITKIPRAALYGAPVTQFPIDERWQWTYGRQTRRKEDEAYCLLGIFEVSMTFRYGEGANAFRRLEEKVNKRLGRSRMASVHNDLDRQLTIRDSHSKAQPPNFGSGTIVLHSLRNEHSLQYPYPRSSNSGAFRGGYEVHELEHPMIDKGLSWEDYFHSLAFEQLHHQKSNVSRHTTGTCAWLLNSTEYELWTQKDGLFLIQGHPGCGKSTLIKYALTERSDRNVRGLSRSLAISFFFHSSGMDLQNGIQGMFRSLLYQLLDEDTESRPAFYELCHEAFGARDKVDRDLKWSQHDLRAIFEKLVVDCSARRTVRIFIDAVDECRSQDHEALIQFFHSLRHMNQGGFASIGIFMTSRTVPIGPIVADFEIRLEDRNRDDIQKYIEKELRLKDETERSQNELKGLLQTKANGSFLWLVLVVQRIHELSRKGVNFSVIKSEVLRCPHHLDQLYEELLGEIVSADILEVGVLLQWICFAVRPLSAEELRVALTIHATKTKSSVEEYLHEDNLQCIPNQQKLRTRVSYLSRGLVDFSSTAPAEGEVLVQFYHESIKEFMLTKGMEMVSRKIGGNQNLAKAADAQLASTCLRFLSCKDVVAAMLALDLDFLEKYPFFKYARDCWFLHAAKAERSGTGDAVEWTYDETLPAWIHLNQRLYKKITNNFAEESQPIHVAAQYGLTSLAQKLLSENGNIDVRNIEGSTPLQLAAGAGQLDIVTLLCKQGADVHQLDAKTSTPLHMASKNGHVEVVKYLLEYGADKDIHTAPSNSGRTPLYIASRNGHAGVVRCLLEAGADSDIHTTTTRDGWTPLCAASCNGHLEVVKHLLEHGADSDVHTATLNSRQTPLYAASRNGHIEVVKQLFKYGAAADIHTTNGSSWTPLYAASCYGHLSVLKYLLEHGASADIHTITNGGQTPLYAAARNGHADVIRHLLKHGADADLHTTNENSWTPLCAASWNGHIEVVECLLDHGADTDIHIPTNDGQTPLYTATRSGHIGVVKYLLKHGASADVHTPNENCWTPLCIASANGHVEVVECLLAHGANTDVNTPTNDGWTPLCVASYYGYLEVLSHLLKHKADVNIQGYLGQTALMCAINQGQKAVSSLLVEASPDLTIKDNFGRSAIDWLKLLKTDPELLRRICPNPEYPPQTDIVRLQMSIRSASLEIIEQQTSVVAGSFNRLGHYLLTLGDKARAIAAFSQERSFSTLDEFIGHDVECDLCHERPIIGTRFVCEVCPDTDLCTTCMKLYQKGSYLNTCKAHQFTEVPLDLMRKENDSVQALLQEIVDRYSNSDSAAISEV